MNPRSLRIGMSNIAGPEKANEALFDLLAEEGAHGVELAASLIWPEPVDATSQERAQLRKSIEGRGLAVLGLHALLFARQELQLLATGQNREHVVDYLKKTVDLCADLGGQSLVLGGPKNRKRGDLPMPQAMQRGAAILRELGDYAATRGCFFSLEALPAPGCDFITNLHECLDLAQKAGTPGVKPHFDTGAASVTDKDTPEKWLTAYLGQVAHCQVNDFDLLAPGAQNTALHVQWAKLLKNSGYQGWLSIEMRRSATPELTVREAIRFVRSTYITMGETT
jgi:D-psicose/D-tagatose/L-ribulose 3-epimerase